MHWSASSWRYSQELALVDPGFRADGVLTFPVSFPLQEVRQGTPEGRATPFYDRLTERLLALPGVRSAGYGACIPLAAACSLNGYPVRAEDTASTVAERPLAGLQPTAPGSFRSLRIPLIAGRGLEQNDHHQRTNAAVISSGLTERLWPGKSPLGRRLEQGGGSPGQNLHFTVVGVVGDIGFDRLRDRPELVVYSPVRFQGRSSELWSASFVVRTDEPPLTLVEPVRTIVADLRPDVPIADVAPMEDVVAASLAEVRFALVLLTVLAVGSLGLSAIGVFGPVAYVVELRRPEFGIRLVLVARGTQLRSLVLRQGVVTMGSGLIVGLVVAAATSRLLEAMLFAVAPTDTTTYLVVVAVLVATALVAALLPARRAARLSPSKVLRR